MKLTNVNVGFLKDPATKGWISKNKAINQIDDKCDIALLNIFKNYTDLAKATMISYDSSEYIEKLLIGRLKRKNCEIAFRWYMWNPDLGGSYGSIIYLNINNFINRLINGIGKLNLTGFVEKKRECYGARIYVDPEYQPPSLRIDIKDKRLEELAKQIYEQVRSQDVKFASEEENTKRAFKGLENAFLIGMAGTK